MKRQPLHQMIANRLKKGLLPACVVAFALACGKGSGGNASPPLLTARDSVAAAADSLALAQIELTMIADSVISAAMVGHAKRPEVRDLASTILRDSHAIRLATIQAARDAGMTIVLPENDLTLSDIPLSLSLITNKPASADVDGLYMSGIVSRDLALMSLVNLRKFSTKKPALAALYTRVAQDERRHGAAVAELEKKSH